MTTIEFNKKLHCGNDFVAVKVLGTDDDLCINGIYLPSSYEANGRLAHCLIEDIGSNAAEKTGCKVGDYGMIDRLSTFAWTAPTAALKYDSVICKTNADKSDYWPLEGSLFVEPDHKDDVTDVNGVYVANYTKRLNTGIITKIGFASSDEYPFNEGDKVMLVKGGDVISFGNTRIHIFKKDMIVCTIEDKEVKNG